MSRPAVRRIALLVVSLGVAATCVRLGFWQLDRLEQRRGRNATIASRLALAPAPLAELLDEGLPPGGLAYRRVRAEGIYDLQHEFTLYGRPLEGRPGDHLLTPLLLEDGTAIVVDRGWIPTGSGASPDPVAPTDPVIVDGYLVEPEAATEPDGTTLSGTVSRLDLTLIGSGLQYSLAPVAIRLIEQLPAQGSGFPVPAPEPAFDEGPHLSYAIQWFSFAAVAVIGYLSLERRERRKA